jgi:hypothetical protein
MKTMNHSEVLLKLAEKFSRTPGPRYASEGNHSGEQFRNEVLFPAYESAVAVGNVLVVILDGTCGYGTSFLEEAFGGLIRENGIPLSKLNASMRIVSEEEPDLLDEVSEYMDEAESQRDKK